MFDLPKTSEIRKPLHKNLSMRNMQQNYQEIKKISLMLI